MGCTVTGLDDVIRILEDVAEKHAKPLASDFCTDVAEAIAEEAKKNMAGTVITGQMRSLTIAERSQGKNFGMASVRVGKDAFYWRFLEYGDGPDRIEHAFFMRAREKVFASIDSVAARRFKERLAKLMKR